MNPSLPPNSRESPRPQTPAVSPVLLCRREWGQVVLLALLVAALQAVPYWLGYAFSTPERAFTGLLMNPEDAQTYLAKMWQGYDGRSLYTIPFTPEEHNGALVGVFYVWLGLLGRWLGLSLPAMWHLSRLLSAFILFLVTYAFITVFLRDRQARWTAYLLAIFGSGLGWLLFLLKQPYWLNAFPVDFRDPGAHLFFTALTFPHVSLGTALTMPGFWFLLRAAREGVGSRQAWAYAAAAGITNIALGICYPFLIYLVALTAGLYWLYLALPARRVRWRLALRFALAFAVPAPLYLYYAYTLHTNVVFRAWDVQAATPSFPWPHYLLAYGPMLLLACLYLRRRPYEQDHVALLWLWLLAVALLLYAPLPPQRRFIQGVHAPLAILATAGFFSGVLPWLASTRPWQALLARPRYSAAGLTRFALVLFLLLMSLSNLYLLASVSVSAVVQQPDPLFRPLDEIEAANWLRRHDEAAVVLADYQTGNYVAAHAGQRVVLGHWAETVDYEAKKAAVARFYDAGPDAWRRDFLEQYAVDYVWHGPREQRLGAFMPETAPYLRPIFTHKTITIYAVTGLHEERR